MTIEGFTPIYRSTTVPFGKPPEPSAKGWRGVLGRYAAYTRSKETVAPSEGRTVARDRADAARLFEAVGRGSVDGYHDACRAASRPGWIDTARDTARDADALRFLLNHAHRLLGRSDGNLLNHAAKARPCHGKEACIALLVRDGIATGARDAAGFTAAMKLSTHRRDAASLGQLVPHMSTSDLDRTNPRDGNRSALHYAIRAGNLQAVDLLIRAGANVNLHCADRSPVAMARQAGHDEIVRCLKRAGGKEGASGMGAHSRPSWSSVSVASRRESKDGPAAASFDIAAEQVEDGFGPWNHPDQTGLPLLAAEPVERATTGAATTTTGLWRQPVRVRLPTPP